MHASLTPGAPRLRFGLVWEPASAPVPDLVPRRTNEVAINEDSPKPISVVLDVALDGTGLSYVARDGFLSIDSQTSILEARVKELDRKLDRVLEALARLEQAK